MTHFAFVFFGGFVCFAGACGGTSPPVGGVGDMTMGGDLTGRDLSSMPSTDAALPPLQYTTQVQVVVEPEDKGQTFITAVQQAKTSIHMTMYLLTDSTIIDALKSQLAAGLDVKVLLNQTFPAGGGSSSSVYAELQSAGVPVRWAPSRYQYTHEKALTLDGKTALIMTMNADYSAFTGNREYLAIDTDPADVAETEAIFEADWSNMTTATTGKLVTAPDNAEARLVQFVDTATKTVDLEGEVFSANSMLQALGRAVKRGVTVRLLLSSETPTTAQTTAIAQMKQVNIPVRTLDTPDIHAKAIVVDGTHAYIGSENFTANSLEDNRELGVLISTQSEVDKIASTINTDFEAGTAQ